MKSIRIISLLLTALSSTPSSVSALSWILNSEHATCEGDPFTNVYITATCFEEYACQSGTCNHKAQCTGGDTPQITGRLTAMDAFSNSQVVVKACLSGYCPKRDSKVDGRVCDWIIPISDQECGEAGDYQIEYFMTLPEESLPNWLFDALTVKIQVDNMESGCQVTEDDGYQLPYPLMGLSVVAGLAIALCRDKRCRRDDEDEEDDEETLDQETYCEDESYVEMGSVRSSNFTPSHADSTLVDPVSISPVHQYNPPPTDLTQSPARSCPDDNNPPTQISLEAVRELYEKQGIAIV
mmetsp:Transcript_28989/g.61732  ORF Transcript_28989/g.61732 Transcript_28989/m.61732 type:complete len:295 (+) Transcript_28989:94-978(+)